MNQTAIFAPFVGTMLLTLAVWIYMYARRIPFIVRGKLTPQQLTPAELARLSPPRVASPSDNLKNLFELPTIFYAVALYLYATSQVDTSYVVAAWIFFVFRVLHSAVHCTFNFVPLRFWLYATSAVALWVMVLRVAWHVLA
ncbi:MAG TPA: MAPEG family protein [Gammaproteobacteria bacterium]|nr:MAPEG family protein [Gammaproteobacteria bacterium]